VVGWIAADKVFALATIPNGGQDKFDIGNESFFGRAILPTALILREVKLVSRVLRSSKATAGSLRIFACSSCHIECDWMRGV